MSWNLTKVINFSVPSMFLGFLLFSASLTPSLIPRGPIEQGVLGGILLSIGYLIGRVVCFFWVVADIPTISKKLRVALSVVLGFSALLVFAWGMLYNLEWQNDLRKGMGITPATSQYYLKIVVWALATFLVFYAIGVAVVSLFRWVRSRLYHFMSERRANVLGFLVVGIALLVVSRDGIFDRVVAFLDESYETAQELFENSPPIPAGSDKVGSLASFVDWGAMGRPGRDFVMGGPNAAAISRFSGKTALDPIRVYVGRANGQTANERAVLALSELKRLGAFERKVLIVASPTGTGWMDPGSHDPVEYMHNGDIATVAVQYSFMQSPLALILETRTGLDQASALLRVVHEYWQTLPREDRPRLYVHGLSLGAWSSMYATNLFRLVGDPIDGAFWVGPPFPSAFWRNVQNSRNEGSPWVLPRIGDGSIVRYASHFEDASRAEAEWGNMRIVFLQYSSDPIVFYDPFSLWRAPPWMNDPPAEDVSEHLTFIPIVTKFQLALDMALSFGSPPGHGHAYFAQDYIAPWAQVTAPEGWADDDTERLKLHCDNGFQMGCSNDLNDAAAAELQN